MRKNTDLSLEKRLNQAVTPIMDDEITASPFNSDVTYSRSGSQKLALIKAMARVSNSGVTVYDPAQGRHVYISENFYKIFGYELNRESVAGNAVFDERVHPADLVQLKENGNQAFRFLQALPVDAKKHYKLINEYRICSKPGIYIRVIEQHQILEQDKLGNIVLSLAVIDIAPDQYKEGGVKSQILNFVTGELVPLSSPDATGEVKITRREREVLEMIRNGLLSKEISALLAISVHTVNTHRQNILEKLGVDNTIEALRKARMLSLI